MDVGGVVVSLDPRATAIAITFVLAGVALGTASGLTPGLHANNFAMLLAGVAPALPGPPRFVGAAMLAAGVVHTFLDVVPALALGVPDASMAPTALPGHRLVLEGKGFEALRLSALGSALAIVAAIPLALPITGGMGVLYPELRPHLPLVLSTIAVALVLSEPTRRRFHGALLSVGLSGGLGILVLDVPADGLVDAGGMLTPLFAGLFGAPVLIDAMSGHGVPPQAGPTITRSRRFVLLTALVGALCGAIVGYVPGVSSAIAATAALVVLPSRGSRSFLVASSGVNTANTVFALFALVALGSPRTGVLVAIDGAGLPLDVPILLASIAFAGATGFLLVLTVGDRYLQTVGGLDTVHVSLSVLALLAGLSVMFAGPIGMGVFVLSTVVGLIPARTGCRRATLMGALLVPLALGI